MAASVCLIQTAERKAQLVDVVGSYTVLASRTTAAKCHNPAIRAFYPRLCLTATVLQVKSLA